MKSGIYKIQCRANGRIYIGSAKNLSTRKYQHLYALRLGTHYNRHLQNAWNKYGEDEFDFSILEFCDIELLIEREQYYIDQLSPTLRFNISPKAGSALGVKHTDETKKKLSIIRKGFQLSPDARKRVSESLSNRWKSIPHPLKGRRNSPESYKKSVETKNQKYGGSPVRKRVCQIDLKTNQIITTFESMTQAAKAVGVPVSNISAICRNAPLHRKGKDYYPKSAGGYGWRYEFELSPYIGE